MGAWSAKIFDDDGSRDIIDEYKILLGYGISQKDTYEKIREYFYPDYQGGDEEDVYWLAIALYQWKNGILISKRGVKSTAFRRYGLSRLCRKSKLWYTVDRRLRIWQNTEAVVTQYMT